MKTGFGVLVVAAAIAGGSWVPQAAGQNTGVISGRVVDAATGHPLEGAVVSLTTRTTPEQSVTVTAESTAGGAFEFKALAAGQYDLVAMRARYLTVYHGQKRPGGPGVPIALAAGQQRNGLTLAMPLTSVIAGMVIDERGEPALGVTVTARRLQWRSGRRAANNAGNAIVDDRGWFRLPGLPPGEYVIVAFPSPNLRTKENVAPVYYPGTPEPARAQEISLGLSEERSGIDFRLQRATLASVSGTVVWSSAAPAPNVRVAIGIIERSELGYQVGTYTAGDGKFSVSNVVPGRHQLYVQARLPSDNPLFEWASVEVPIDGTNVTDLRLTLQPGIKVIGRISGDRLKTPLPGALALYVERAELELAGQGLPRYMSGADGRFSLEGIPGGLYWLRLGDLPPGVFVASMTTGGREIYGLPIEFAPEKPLGEVVITVTDRPTVLSGKLSDAAGQGVSDYFVIAFPNDEKYWLANSPRIRVTRPATDGTYTFRGLPPGSYRVAALGDADPDQWSAPPFLRRLVPASETTTLADGESRTLDLRIK